MTILAFIGVIVFAGGGDTSFTSELLRHYQERRPLSRPLPAHDDAEKVRQAFITALAAKQGPIVGYKAALTSPAARSRFGVGSPLWGSLLEKMLLPEGALVSSQAGTRLMFEGDLMVRVGDASINTAKTRGELLNALDAVIPFIELPDLVYAPDTALDGPSLRAINVGARLGVYGEAIPMDGAKDWETRLGNLRLELLDGRGQLLAEGRGHALMGHPLEVVLWLRNTLKAEGIALKKGDLLSLGSLTRPMPVKAPGKIKAIYHGLVPDKPVSVTVSFSRETD